MHRLQTLGGFGGKADQLNAYNTYLGVPDGFDTDLERYLSASADRLRDAAGQWLQPGNVDLPERRASRQDGTWRSPAPI